MEQRTLGKTDLQIAPIVFGGNVFGWTIDEQQSFEILDHFVGAGFNMIDTANQYAYWAPGNKGGESETVIGNWLKKTGKRDEVLIATKVGGALAGQPKPNTAKAYILEQVELSLQRLQVDVIDLYQTHFDDESVPVEETLEAYDQLIKQGKVRWIGASNLSPRRLEDSLNLSAEKGLPAYQTLQPEYNLYAREQYETAYEPVAVKHQLGVITYYSLASGFLTGKYRTEADMGKSVRGGGVQKMFDERGKKILAALDHVSGELRSTPAAVALAWLLSRPSVTAPIVSATSLEQMKSFTDAVQLQLPESSSRELDEASAY
ncbi:alcohol dehydrogenase [Niabella ginsenosidivorans]|uniref:Alcohol dehydrogenase n=1 Tax=Niabella ginsenosidivorans TaxID=1176587 RepID=A0A1A9I2A9_9BACT|nr:aldo/keto reductase [Niabella ginsenosidivorans]ANH81756.1 alcohol dehydrogenase [Niabella ginsenosidivorans]